jgi:sugar phosphate isomerase/epimerase
MYKNLNAGAFGVTGRQSELIELALTYGFRGLEVDGAELIRRASLQGIDEAARYIRSAKVKLGGFCLPMQLAADEKTFTADAEKLPGVAELASELGFTHCEATLDAASESTPYHENFETHRARLAQVADILAQSNIRLGVAFQAAANLRPEGFYPFIHQAEELLTLLKTVDSGNIGLAFDSWNWKLGGGGNDQLSEVACEQIVSVSLADVDMEVDPQQANETHRILPSEETMEENSAVLALLAKDGYDGPVTLTPYPGHFAAANRDANIDKCAKTLDALFAAAGLTKSGKLAAASEA